MAQNQNTAMLPLEILDHIFSFLDDHWTWTTLRACSAIRNPILRTAIDRRMYTHVILSEWGISDEFYYLSSNRHVASYIRSLHIAIVHPRIDRSSQWYDQVSSILQMLSSLERITLSSLLYIDATVSGTSKSVLATWSDFPEIFRKAFLNCLWSPNIIEASIKRIEGFPLSIFNPCTRLKRLSLLHAKCIPSTEAQFPPQIDSLVLNDSEDLAAIVSWASKSHDLRSLIFRLDHRADHRAGYGQLIRLLDSYSDTLIELELDFRSLYHLTFSLCKQRIAMLTLSHVRKLTQLTISAYLHCHNDSGLCVDSLIPAIISLVVTSPSLERLILRATMSGRILHVNAVPDFCKPLVSLVEHPSLEHIELGIILENDEIVSDIISSLKRVPELKKLCNTGYLSVRRLE